MNLSDYISESVSGKRKNRRNRLFSDEPSMEEVSKILTDLGFVRLEYLTGDSIDGFDTIRIRSLIRINSKETGKIFNIGKCTSKGTNWIEFGDKDWFFKLRLGKDFKAFNDGSSIGSMRMYDLNNDGGVDRMTAFTDIVEFEKEIFDKLL